MYASVDDLNRAPMREPVTTSTDVQQQPQYLGLPSKRTRLTYDEEDSSRAEDVHLYSGEFVFNEEDYLEDDVDYRDFGRDYNVDASMVDFGRSTKTTEARVPYSRGGSSVTSSGGGSNTVFDQHAHSDEHRRSVTYLPRVYIRSVPLLRRSKRQLGSLSSSSSSLLDKLKVPSPMNITKPDLPPLFQSSSTVAPSSPSLPVPSIPTPVVQQLPNVSLPQLPNVSPSSVSGFPNVFGFPQSSAVSPVFKPSNLFNFPSLPDVGNNPLSLDDQDRQRQIVENVAAALQKLQYLHRLFSGASVLPFASIPFHSHVKDYCRFFHSDSQNEYQMAQLNRNMDRLINLFGQARPKIGDTDGTDPLTNAPSKNGRDTSSTLQSVKVSSSSPSVPSISSKFDTDESKDRSKSANNDQAAKFGECVDRAREMCISDSLSMKKCNANQNQSSANDSNVPDHSFVNLDTVCANHTSPVNQLSAEKQQQLDLEARKNRTQLLLEKVELRMAVPGEQGSNKKVKVVTVTPELLAKQMRSISDQFPQQQGLVSICYHNQPPRMFDDYPNSPNDTEEVRNLFSGTRDAAHNPEKGVNLDRPDYINALILDLKHLDRDFIALCLEDPSPSSSQVYLGKCLNFRVRRNV